MRGEAFHMDPLEESILLQAERTGRISAKLCEGGEDDPEGCAHQQVYENMKDRGLLRWTGFRGSRHSPGGQEFADYRPTEAGLALLKLKRAGRL